MVRRLSMGRTARRWLGAHRMHVGGPEWPALLAHIEGIDSVLGPDSAQDPLAGKRLVSRAGLGALDVPVGHGGQGRPLSWQLAVQFCLGYRDLNLRDCADLGHARLLLHCSSDVAGAWVRRAVSGETIALAATEPDGGTAVMHRMSTRGEVSGDVLVINGAKAWVSRLREAAGYLVFFRDTGSADIGMALVPRGTRGVQVELRRPGGLLETSWGWLRLTDVRVPRAFAVREADGAKLFREHFTTYRKIAAALVLGAAAAAVDDAVDVMQSRVAAGRYRVIRDTSAEMLARNWARVDSGVGWLLARAADPDEAVAKLVKASAVEVALEAARWCLQATGASGYEAGARAHQRLTDVQAYLFADGAQDALWRSGGRALSVQPLE